MLGGIGTSDGMYYVLLQSLRSCEFAISACCITIIIINHTITHTINDAKSFLHGLLFISSRCIQSYMDTVDNNKVY